jgi:formylmethanofuran dehydrogenase subunit A
MKRKEYNSIKNKIVNITPVLSRGERVPVFELEFKENGFSRTGGQLVYIDYKCAKELVEKLQDNLNLMYSKYFPQEFYNSLHSKINLIS